MRVKFPKTKKLIKGLMPPKSPSLPRGKVNFKTHKEGITHTHIPVRPIIDNTNAPTGPIASYLGQNLTKNLGIVSEKHVRSTEHFAENIKTCTVKGRLLSLDVENLFSCIPVPDIIRFLRDCSGGWGPNPPLEAKPINPPVYSFDIDSKLFCDLCELCLSFNQFTVDGRFYRQIKGLFMGSSISPPMAMTYMEYFEKHIYEVKMPDNLKASVWNRFVDDCYLVYEHSDSSFETFLRMLNGFDPFIKFTYEKSKPGTDYDLGPNVVEVLPFLDLMVIRHSDPETNTLSNKLAIYRKPCHSGAYIHSVSQQSLSTKRSVIRSMFLRAYRYCDTLFLDKEIQRIYADFSRLGYKRRFIDKARVSAKKGRAHEIMIRNGTAPPRPPRTRREFSLVVPYHRHSRRLKPTLGIERDVDVLFTSKDSIMSRITRKDPTPAIEDHGTYLLPCILPPCEQIYIGQSKQIPTRMQQHRQVIAGKNGCENLAPALHKGNGHKLEPDDVLVPYHSTNKSRRLMVEASLITICNTVDNTQATSTTRDFDTIAPILLGASNIDWRMIATYQPSLNPKFVPRRHRGLFRSASNMNSTHTDTSSGAIPCPPPFLPSNYARYPLRSRTRTPIIDTND